MLKKLLMSLLIGSIIVSPIKNSLAQEVISINKGTLAPFNGILFPKEKADQIRIELIERDQFKLFNKTLLDNSELQNKIINNQKNQVEILLKQNTKLINSNNSISNTERLIWFGLGVISSGLAVYGASLLVRK